MENAFHGFPLLKRFKLLQQSPPRETPPSCLPAKKRIESRLESFISTCCLPAKKRVWAPDPALFPFELVEAELGPKSPAKKKVSVIPDLNEPTKQSPGSSQAEDCRFPEVEEDEEDDGIICSVCNSTDGDPSDPIVFCDGCDLMVHASCYGNPLIQAIPEGDWFCARCKLGEEKDCHDTSCCLCPIGDGAAKPTVDGRWAHLMCSLLVPEVFFRDPVGREGIDCSRVPSKRWAAVCYLCGSSNGCGIECSEPKCSLAFHVSCGMKEELSIEYTEGKNGAIIAGFCKSHTQLWEKQQQSGRFKIVPREDKQGRRKKAQ
ncbi:hypothetical protein H6P81_005687 [Aristolochia fimbriata]|uniref:Protein Jade-1 n=1 Tax=Aristolochia fimbriata TaxID=158543 RepID=A0AAV7EVC0_ARIFI|nr:hypothetical protein H6P81_005687 [Aristolochia fimbriata]